jgi:phage regulator Rha-like protein
MKTEPAYTDEKILNQIYMIRGQKIMFDFDLAALYGVETKQAVRRNLQRFPADFMFELTQQEFENQRSQIVTFNSLKYRPFCFTEQGVTMIACVLNSQRAVEMNVRIIRLFTRMRQEISFHQDILAKLEEIEMRVDGNSDDITSLFGALQLLLDRTRRHTKPSDLN